MKFTKQEWALQLHCIEMLPSEFLEDVLIMCLKAQRNAGIKEDLNEPLPKDWCPESCRKYIKAIGDELGLRRELREIKNRQ